LESAGQYLFSARLAGEAEPVGMLWFAMRNPPGRKSAYIYDIQVYAAHRGKGYGTELLKRAEETAAAMGAEQISLNVMGWNHVARALYEKAGFSITGMGMMKKLPAPTS
jgi:ribosomal protein S18 acetylase RimI-like enzyme